MVIVADERIPGLDERLANLGEVRLEAGHRIDNASLADATALIVRSVTEVGADLVSGTPVRFVGTAGAGFDHIAVEELSALGVEVAHAPGSNAPAVVDYVVAALFELGRRLDTSPLDLTIGVIGVGQVGGRLRDRLKGLGIETVLNDPPLQERANEAGQSTDFIPLDELLERADVVSLHVPLTHGGPHPTVGLIGSPQFETLGKGSWLLNTSRGGVVDEAKLIDAIESGHIVGSVVDTWVNEPDVDCRLVGAVSLATPHIAAYATESKARATKMVSNALLAWAGKVADDADSESVLALPIAAPDPSASDADFCTNLLRQAYDIERDHLRMLGMCSFEGDTKVEVFRELRDRYRLRNELASFAVPGDGLSAERRRLVEGLGMAIG